MNQRGIIYLMSLIVVMFLTILSGALLARSVSETNFSQRVVMRDAAFQLAEAGIDRAAHNLRTPTITTDDILSASFSTGSYTINSPAIQLGPTIWQVTTHGASSQDPSHTRNLEATFQLTPQSVFQFALFGDQGVSVGGSAITDSYNSTAGPYNDNAASPTYNKDHHGDVGTNAATPGGVTIGGSIFVDGQVAVGPNASSNPTSVVTGYNPAFITGGTSPPSDTQDVVAMSDPFPMPDVVIPAGIHCDDFTVNGNSTVTLSPTGGPFGNGTYCYHDLTVQGGGALTATGHVTIYLTGQLIFRGNSTVGVQTDPRQVLILMSSNQQATIEEGTLTGSTEFYGALYAPSANIQIQGNADVFGSIVAKSVSLTGSAAIHYDEALTQLTDISNTYRTKLISWRDLS